MPDKRPTYALDQSPFYRLNTRRKLATILKISDAELRALSKGNVFYREFDIPKKSGGVRHVENPSRPLKIVQTRITKLLGRISPPNYLFCPVKGRSYVTNAAQHRGHRVVRCLDIRKYFPNTSARRVFWFFNTVMKCERDVAATLTRLATYQEHLPTGSPLSPILAYFAHIDVWEAIAGIAQAHGYTLTVYIDDVTISGDHVRAAVVWDIKREIHRAGLRSHKEKTFIDRPAEITGIILRPEGLRAPNRQLLKIKKIKSRLLKKEICKQEEVAMMETVRGLAGQIDQIKSMNQELAASRRGR